MCATGAACDGGGADGKVSLEREYLSPYVEKCLNSKVIKSFVPELRSRKCFFVFRDSYVISVRYGHYVRFTYPYHGYVTRRFPNYLASLLVVYFLFVFPVLFPIKVLIFFSCSLREHRFLSQSTFTPA